MSESTEYTKYANKKSEVTSALKEFIDICEKQGRVPKEEILDCIFDADEDVSKAMEA